MLLVVLILVAFIGHYFSNPFMALSLHVCVAAMIQGKTMQYFVVRGEESYSVCELHGTLSSEDILTRRAMHHQG
jgi:hypothetical protein